ncbi:MAG: hypothetical protein SOR40_03490 [Rothia sp. (in: high G+C Gram-positive bacteria)]|nr:hypothetical protein [Rothia sp. (in: high G+C Gram-positive bacteria)]
MAEKKTAAHAAAGLQPGSGTTPVAHQVNAVHETLDEETCQRLLAGSEQEALAPVQELAPLTNLAPGLGSTLTDPSLRARFEGVKENLAREIRSGMCTLAQAYAYLENLEISLYLEQEEPAMSA